MRNALGEVLRESWQRREGPAHAGLAYERWAPPKPTKEGEQAGGRQQAVPEWDEWLAWLEKSREPEGYEVAFRRWRDALRESTSCCFQARASSRLLLGHGNPAPSGVGLTLHHTWGVPVLPGSALKGLLGSYVQSLLGPDSEAELSAQERARFQGVRWEGKRRVGAPGEVYRRLFGAPDVDDSKALAGEVIFHDALWVARQPGTPEMLARDVLTVHQKDWYGGKAPWPGDYDSPNPVSFLTVRPGACFLVALSVAPGSDSEGVRLLHWATECLGRALAHWGLGGKTAAGYGRLEPESPPELFTGRPRVRRSSTLTEFLQWLGSQKEARVQQRDLLESLESQWKGRLLELPAPEREECRRALSALNVRKPALAARMTELLARLSEGR